MIHLNLRQLEYFVAAARHGGAARAAESMNVSQPSISKAIADLESLWGEPLFVRLHARGLALTAAGAARHREAHALLTQAQALESPRSPELAGLLRVGCLSTLAPRWLPSILAQLRASHPAVEVQLHEGDTETLTRMLERGALDVALLYDLGLARPGVTIEPVAGLVPYALLPWGHRLAAHGSLALATLAREPLVLINLPHSREYFLSLFRQAGVAPVVAYETTSLEMVRSLVANGLGVSLLTTRPVHDRSQDGKRIACRRLRGPLAAQAVALAYPAAESFRSALAAPFAAAVHQGFAAAQG
ncbi:LysR substrate-binding domain-containing protein [Variovorax sp. KK3]|uniref:LysR substrate-binding domain-containing protein n=1 Tax=Variovorax sp. KK3 TaxID=1855728 RepID=UPI00097C55B2|nr:LysR substrate-binding domain-containing protein [Variovorax sp. KK3]